MKDQHEKITGYRDLTQEEIDDMNAIKAHAEEVGAMIEALLCKVDSNGYDGRWAAIAKTHLQEGFMAATRSVARPNSF